jgi:GNAT superfamily N-acetyltransferase
VTSREPTAASDLDVAAIDPSDSRAFDEWFDILRTTDLERWPDLPGWQRAELLARALDEDGPQEFRCLVARRAQRVVGMAGVEMYRRENGHLANFEVHVLPEHRRQGVGTALVGAVERVASAAGRTELGGFDDVPKRAGFEDTVGPFARHLGFSVVQRMVRRCLSLPLEPARADVLRRNPKVSSCRYSLVTFADRWPDEYLTDRCEFGRRMSTDVPLGEQELGEEVWDRARVRGLEAALEAQNRAKVTTVARDDATGRLVAYTEVVVPLGAPESAWQHDTLVLREHRGHGLGFAVKVTNLFAIVERHPDVRRINTRNAADNEHMIAVNEEIGFEVTAHSTHWLRAIAH